MTKKIMLIEDDITMLSLLRTLLQMEGFEVVHANEGSLENMIDRLHHEQPALAMMDVNLRDTNGFEVLRAIRNDENLKTLKVIMSSGMDFSDECVNGGANGFLLKPYMPDDLMALIHQNLAE